MNSRTTLALAAAFAVAGISTALAQNAQDQNPTAANQPAQMQMQQGQQQSAQQNLPPLKLPDGVTAKQSEDAKDDVSKEISKMTSKALEPDFEDTVDYLVDQDRNRIGEHKNLSDAQLKQAADQFKQNWKQKYNQDFDMDHPDQLFANAQIATGEIKDPQQVVSHWPVSILPGQTQAMPAAAQQGLTDDTKTQGNIAEGRDLAIFRLPPGQGGQMSALDVSLIHEAGGWKVDIPNSITGQQVHDGLLAQINHLNQNVAQWPSDANQAREMVARCVLMGVYNVPQTQSQAQ